MTAEQRRQQQAEYTRQLLDAVYEPQKLKQQQIQETRRRNLRAQQQQEDSQWQKPRTTKPSRKNRSD